MVELRMRATKSEQQLEALRQRKQCRRPLCSSAPPLLRTSEAGLFPDGPTEFCNVHEQLGDSGLCSSLPASLGSSSLSPPSFFSFGIPSGFCRPSVPTCFFAFEFLLMVLAFALFVSQGIGSGQKNAPQGKEITADVKLQSRRG